MAIDLEHFPTNETAIRMMERISPIYDRSYVGKWIFEIMGMEMGEARAYFEELRQQIFPECATWTVEYWERRYSIVPKPSDNLDNRRLNITIKRGARLPMNPARMERIIDDMTGGQTTVTENVDGYTFSVVVNGAIPGTNLADVVKAIKARKPSHQTLGQATIVCSSTSSVLYIGGTMGTIARIPVPEL